jgi:acetyl esterase/lipase
MDMTSEPLVDPELKPALAAFPQLQLSPEALPAMRAAMVERRGAIPVPEGLPVTVETLTVPGLGGAPPIRVLAYAPTNVEGLRPALLHIHGGGYVIGTADMMDAANRELAADLGCAIFSVDYRLAPETAHPGPVEDCYAALKWVSDNAAKLKVDPTRIGVKGESAGGGLAAGLALLARDRGELSLAFQHLIYPMIDDRTCIVADPHPFVGEFVWTPADNVLGWSALLGSAPGGPDIPPYAAAARATDLSRLPPTFISVGALDLFLEEDLDYARRLSRAGVPVEFHVYPGAFHGFGMMPGARVSVAAERDSREALRRALHG